MEWIKYYEAEKVFDLRTEHSTYQMQVSKYDLWFICIMESSRRCADHRQDRMCGQRIFRNPYEAEKDKTFFH